MNLQPLNQLCRLCLSLLLAAGFAVSVGVRPLYAAIPVPTAIEEAKAQRVAQMPDEAPADRINQLLSARDFGDAELFVLAATHPGIVEQLVQEKQRLATNYLFALTGANLHRIRNSGTLIRTNKIIDGKEKKALYALCDHFGVDRDKFRGVRLGPIDGRVYRLELTIQGKKKKKRFTRSMEMAWPATPERDEASRIRLTKHFGARPSRTGRGAGSVLPVQDGSFERPNTLSTNWRVETGVMLGAPTPIQQVMVDSRVAIDGIQSLRFFGTEKTRVFQKVVQDVVATQGSTIRLRIQHKTELARLEFQQRRTGFAVRATPINPSGFAVGPSWVQNGRLGTHPWELIEIGGQVPPGASHLRIEIEAAISGTTWFDGLLIEVQDG